MFLIEFLSHIAFNSCRVGVIADSFLPGAHMAETVIERNSRTFAHTFNLHHNRLSDQVVKTMFFGLN